MRRYAVTHTLGLDLNTSKKFRVLSSIMQTAVTERQQAADLLYHAFLTSLVLETEAQISQEIDRSDSSSESGSGNSSSSSEASDGDSDELQPSSEVFLRLFGTLYSRRYLQERSTIEKDGSQLKLLLTNWKVNRPDIFRSYCRVMPACFDDILAGIKDDEAFQNNSRNEQAPVDQQLAIALFRFGHFGNAASTMKVALWAGVGYGTVRLFTNHVMLAVCKEKFRRSVLRWADQEAKEKAKDWVESVSCPAWRDGWLMVDGTLVPLFMRPGFYGNTWYDRKSNYSINVQVLSSYFKWLHHRLQMFLLTS